MKLTISLAIFVLAADMCLAKKEVNFVRIANCPEYKNTTYIMKNVVITRNRNGKSNFLRLELLITKEVKRMIVVLTVRKCDNSGNLDTCEYFMKDFKIKNSCDIIGQKNQIWSDTLAKSNFPRRCPIPAGTYKFNDTKLDDDMQLAFLPIPVALWKGRLFIYDDIMIACCDLDVQVYTARRN